MSCQTLSDTLLRGISNLYDKTDDYNVKIQVGEDSKMEIFKAHSVILRARSNYFRTAFSSNWAKKEGDFYIFKKPNICKIYKLIFLMFTYVYTGTIVLDTINVENNSIGLLLAADEMNLYELIEHLQQHIIELSNANNSWIAQNGVNLFNSISYRKGVFPKLEELYDEALLLIIQLDNLEMEEIVIWENLIKWGIAKNSILNSDMTIWNIDEYEILKETISPFIQHIRFFQMSPQEYYYKICPLSKLLPKELELSYYIVPDCKMATKALPPRKSQIYDSLILTVNHFNLISYWIDNGHEVLPNPLKYGQYEYNLLLRGSRDGFEPQNFHLKCNNKGATLVIIKLKNSCRMIGGYNPIKWSGSKLFLNSDKSFIFLFSNNLYTSKVILSRVENNASAISDSNSVYQGFGNGDLYIFRKSCKLVSYTTKILDTEYFDFDDYEVFQVIKK
ncbi:hypothetical protein RclHR1_01980013 [Rhizophagus clarus]|uniref:BTB/POZ protein n=1 Tax=Rhizophagus clarus TaxID=94130 RepID=A0A2Z6RI71_9GLOM|nr:hypothetical protein RclHR1_01980013 [Rhizophagus clarus]GES92979.1 BTB/POZ protein [Rhizophagus clarus]